MRTGPTFEDWFTSELPDAPKDVWPTEYLQQPFPQNVPGTSALAWDVYIELSTRIATQSLPLHSGEEKSALKSLRDLFQLTRDALHKREASSGELASIILKVLNEKVRPVTAYWHGVIGEGAFVHADEAGNFRADLLDVQRELRLLADFLGYAAHGATYHDVRIVQKTTKPVPRYAPTPLKAVTTTPPLTGLAAAEQQSIAKRRTAMGLNTPAEDTAGVALSGGGIRSATFSLGVLTALSRVGLYHQFDYLSTVSGGGYTGTLISTWATAVARGLEEKASESPATKALLTERLKQGPLRDDATTEHLRDRSRYLIEDGLEGIFSAAVPIALGMLAAIATLVLTTAVTLPLVWLGRAAFAMISAHEQLCGAVTAGLIVITLVTTRMTTTRIRALELSSKALVGASVLFLPALAVCVVDALHRQLTSLLPKLTSHVDGRALLAAVPAVLTSIGSLLQKRATTLRIALPLLAASPWIGYAIGLSWLASCVSSPHWPNGAQPNACDYWCAALLAALILVALVDINVHSPLGYYRDRLAATYCVAVADDGIIKNEQPPKMSELTELAPIHLLNATVNLPASRARNDRGRGAANLVFSKHGWTYPAEDKEKINAKHAPLEGKPKAEGAAQNLDISLAMAISGAAVSPMMGTMTLSGSTPWLTLLNLRLNAWLPTPGRSSWWIPNGACLLLELIGKVGIKGSRLNLSDGGHFENLGVYELIRRRCRYIVAIDGEADPELACSGLMNLIQLARVDFGAEIRVNPRKLKLDAQRFAQSHLLCGEIKYKNGSEGHLLYLKLSVTGDEPAHLLAYRSREPVFPHHSTADQVFSEEQFECYRALGQHLGESLFRTELVGTLATTAQQRSIDSAATAVSLEEWFEQLDGVLNRRVPS
jgi:hypothetical protein